MGWAFSWLRVVKERVKWDDKKQDVRYSIDSTTDADAAKELAAERSGKKRKGYGQLA